MIIGIIHTIAAGEDHFRVWPVVGLAQDRTAKELRLAH
jgi:hypothetical protein